MAKDMPLVRGREPFERFYGREYRAVLALAYVLSGNPSLAEELTQDAFVAAFRKWDEIENPEGWVRSVMSKHAHSWFRRRYAEARALTRLGTRPDVSVDQMPVETAHFWDAVRRLPRRQAQVIALVYLEDCSVKDAAAIIGCSQSTARVHLMRGRRRLAIALDMEEEA